MIAADYDDNPLLDMACPDCSFLRARHRELLEDVLIFPTILHAAPREGVRFRDGKYRVIGCPHVASCFGPHATQEAAQQAVRDRFMAMRRGDYEQKEQRLGAPPESGEHAAAGEDAAAGACQVGSNIWMQHLLGINGKCVRCNFQYPKLNLKP